MVSQRERIDSGAGVFRNSVRPFVHSSVCGDDRAITAKQASLWRHAVALVASYAFLGLPRTPLLFGGIPFTAERED